MTAEVAADSLTGVHFLVTGGSGFFGGYFIDMVLARGASVINVDIVAGTQRHVRLRHHRVDIRDQAALRAVFATAVRIDAAFHFAALLAHGDITAVDLHAVNVDGTRNLLGCCREFGVRHLVFTSTNCLWGAAVDHPIAEHETPNPCESYGVAKRAAEQVLLAEDTVACAIVRTPTIVQAGRLGLLAILFEFIDEGRRIWAVGGGDNCYQFVAAQDLAAACLLAAKIERTEIFHVGSAQVPTLRESYEYVIRHAGSRSRVATLPKWIALPLMRAAEALHLSPLGPYHRRMIAESFRFDTRKAERLLGWQPTLGNNQILLDAFCYYRAARDEIRQRTDVSAHRRATPMGVIKLLKWLS